MIAITSTIFQHELVLEEGEELFILIPVPVAIVPDGIEKPSASLPFVLSKTTFPEVVR